MWKAFLLLACIVASIAVVFCKDSCSNNGPDSVTDTTTQNPVSTDASNTSNSNNDTTSSEATLCGKNEYYEPCVLGDCTNQSCNALGRAPSCLGIPGPCYASGCRCIPGYYRDADGVCIPKYECPTLCGKNEYYEPCERGDCKNQSCNDLGHASSCPGIIEGQCYSKGCRCIPGYYRDADGVCIPQDECPRCEGINELWVKCIDCSNQTCAEIGKVINCPNQPAGQCKSGCRCYPGLYRNDKNVCVPEHNCPKPCGQNEYWEPLIQDCNNQSCKEYIYGQRSCPGDFAGQGSGCRCISHYFRNADNVCISLDECRLQESNTVTSTSATPPITDSGDSESDNESNWLEYLKNGITGFTGRFLYDKILASRRENVITSPFSVFTPLVQMVLYTNGESFNQLTNLLNLSNKQKIRSAFPTLISSFDGQTSVNFSIASKMYSDRQAPLSDEFKKDSVDVAHAEAQELDFSKNVEAADTINAWVESKTNNRIKDLIQSSDLSSLTRLVLVNAIYFKGSWILPFDKANTKDADFYLSDGTTKKTKMMYQNKFFNYAQFPDFGFTAVQMYYEGRNFSMVIVLPNEKDGLLKTAENLQDESLFNEVLRIMKTLKVKVYLPTFEINTSTDLTAILKQNGVTKIFDPRDSGLSGILKTPEDTHVSKAIQKAFIKVNEYGSEAAAANAVIVGVTSAFPGPSGEEIIFRCDHSFLYYITFQDTVIFAGAVANPN